MEIIGPFGALVALILIGIGLAIGLLVCASLAVLLSLGVISSSVLVGMWKRRTLAGLQVFFVQTGVLLGAPVGVLLAWAGSQVWPLISGDWQVLAAGAVGGAGGGLVIAWLASAAASGVVTHAWPWLRARVTVFPGFEG